MTMTRRALLHSASALALLGPACARLALADTAPAVAFLDKSALIYLTPIRSNGEESACHGEVWFVHHEGEIYVVTKADAWRAEALSRGLTRARIWIGEFGVWTRAKERYRSAPRLMIEGRHETDAATHASVLEVFGRKYADEWGTWGPRFRDGLADGSRVMLRYRVTT